MEEAGGLQVGESKVVRAQHDPLTESLCPANEEPSA